MLSQVCGAVRLAHAMPVCVYCFVSSWWGFVYNPSAGAITDQSQSAKDIDPYFKSQLYVEDPCHRKPELILQNGLSKLGERARKTFFLPWVGFESTTARSTAKRVTTELTSLCLKYYVCLVQSHCRRK